MSKEGKRIAKKKKKKQRMVKKKKENKSEKVNYFSFRNLKK